MIATHKTVGKARIISQRKHAYFNLQFNFYGAFLTTILDVLVKIFRPAENTSFTG